MTYCMTVKVLEVLKVKVLINDWYYSIIITVSIT